MEELFVPCVGCAITIVVLAGVVFLGLPLLILAQQRLPARPEVFELDFDDVTMGVEKYMRGRMKELKALGFGEPTLVQIPESAPGVDTYLIMLANREAGDKAMVTAIIGKEEKALYVEFSTRFDTGEVVDTFNSAQLGAFPPGRQTIRTQVPEVKEPAELYRLHRYVMHKHGLADGKEVYEPGKALRYLMRAAFLKPYEEMVERGWLTYVEAGDYYRPSLMGAYLMTWGLIEPMKSILSALMRHRGRQLVAEMDAADFD